MEKQLSAIGYWLGLICTVIALILRLFVVLNIAFPRIAVSSGMAISYQGFLHATEVFFLLAIASWCRTAKFRSSVRSFPFYGDCV
jgi:hypothetical protein